VLADAYQRVTVVERDLLFRALPTVEIVDRCDVVVLVTTAARDRVTGVRSTWASGRSESPQAQPQGQPHGRETE